MEAEVKLLKTKGRNCQEEFGGGRKRIAWIGEADERVHDRGDPSPKFYTTKIQ